ncbi:GlsB/YeaQ/YmgE family stress response membrane protein [Bacteroidota bacterium]
MTFLGFIVLLCIAAFCGLIGQKIAGYSLGGCSVSIILGFIGAWLGPQIADKLGFPLFVSISIQGYQFPIVWSIIGAMLFTVVVGAVFKERKNDQ